MKPSPAAMDFLVFSRAMFAAQQSAARVVEPGVAAALMVGKNVVWESSRAAASCAADRERPLES